MRLRPRLLVVGLLIPALIAASIPINAAGVLAASRRQVHVDALQPADRLEEIRFLDIRAVLTHCADMPSGYAAGCEHLQVQKVHSIGDCARLLRVVEGGDTLNFADDVCQIQRCAPTAAPAPGVEDRAAPRGSVPRTRLYGGMAVYSFLCSEEEPRELPGPGGAGDVGKTEDYWTTSVALKQDIRAFFSGMAANWTALEVGAYRGYTTRVLSEVFKRVIAVEASEVFLEHNRMHNSDRDNIVYIQLHTRIDGLRSLRSNDVHVVMVDAEHDYSSVLQDVQEVFRFLGSGIRFLIFDDYATDEGVRRVVDSFVEGGELKVVGGLGFRPPWSYHGTVVHSWEGVVCEVLRHKRNTSNMGLLTSISSDKRMLSHWYAWFTDSLWHSDDTIEFHAGGVAVSTRGPGTWRVDESQVRGIWLNWPSHRPATLGDRPQFLQRRLGSCSSMSPTTSLLPHLWGTLLGQQLG